MESRRRSAPGEEVPPLPTSARPSQDCRTSVVALLPGQRIALEEEQKRKEEQPQMLPGQRIALEEEKRLKERKLMTSKSESTLQQKQHSASAYVNMSHPAAKASTITRVVEQEIVDTGQSPVNNKVFFGWFVLSVSW